MHENQFNITGHGLEEQASRLFITSPGISTLKAEAFSLDLDAWRATNGA
jgi:hypothetical protein